MGGIETTPIYGGLGISEGKISWHNLNVVQHVEEEVALDATAHAGTYGSLSMQHTDIN